MSLSQRIFKSMAAQLAGRLYTSAVSFVITMVILARVLSPEDFGIFNYYLTFYYVFITIIDFGANTITVREASQDEQRLPGLLLATIRLRGVLSLAGLLLVCGVALVMEESTDLRLWICLASLHLLFYSLGGFNALFHIRMRFDLVALVSCLGHTVFFVVGGILYLCGSENPAHYLAAYGLGMAMSNIANYFVARPFLPEKLASAKAELGLLFRQALPLGLSSVMVTVYFYVDTLLLRPLQGEAAVGYYNAAYRLLTFTLMVPVLFNQVLFPVFSKYFGGAEANRETLQRFFRRAVLYMAVTGIPGAAAMAVLSRPLVVLACGEKYACSADCLAILGLAMACVFLTYPHTSLLVSSGRQALFAWIAAAGGIFNLGLNLVLIPAYSYEGAAWATVVTEFLVLASGYVCLRRTVGLNPWQRALWKTVPLTLAAAGTAYLLQDQPLWLNLPVVGAVYLVLLFAFKLLPFDMHDEDRNRL